MFQCRPENSFLLTVVVVVVVFFFFSFELNFHNFRTYLKNVKNAISINLFHAPLQNVPKNVADGNTAVVTELFFWSMKVCVKWTLSAKRTYLKVYRTHQITCNSNSTHQPKHLRSWRGSFDTLALKVTVRLSGMTGQKTDRWLSVTYFLLTSQNRVTLLLFFQVR